MAKKISLGNLSNLGKGDGSKRSQISDAQQYMILAVLGASAFLGIAIALVSHFTQQISFNTAVIMAEEESIVNYSEVIAKTGVCKAPNGSTYSDEELKNCDPSSIEAKEIPGTLRANILQDLASNAALASVPKEDDSSCRDPETRQVLTFEDLDEIYEQSRGSSSLQEATNLILSCSALRIIPDTLPAFKNEEGLLASLNKLFLVSDWEPESITPGGVSSEAADIGTGLNPISVNFTVDASTSTSMNVLRSIERSIREFNVNRLSIEWKGEDELILHTQATAYYMDSSKVSESKTTITAEGK